MTPAPPSALPAPTRAAGLARLAAFLPEAGAAYARNRNLDLGPARRDIVSLLSAHVRHRLLTEREICAAVLERHSLAAAEKFIQEVLWRTYWKGWLEMRPNVWRRYLAGRDAALETLERDGGLRRDIRAATEGRTGIEGFDDWARELVATGYLHNHARMWFASIWIFTLRLPWELGADFFLRHLADADAASNTLSWRWVGGLQTRGKTYLATPDNIARCTGGRFSPKGLATAAEPLTEPPPEPPRPLAPMPERCEDADALLLLEDDYGVETLPADWRRIEAVVVVNLALERCVGPIGERARAFAGGAATDTIARLAALAPQAAVAPDPLRRLAATDIIPWLPAKRARTLALPETPVGWTADAVALLETALKREGVGIRRFRRRWDAAAWPHATRGFFQFRERIPDLLAAEGLIGP